MSKLLREVMNTKHADVFGPPTDNEENEMFLMLQWQSPGKRRVDLFRIKLCNTRTRAQWTLSQFQGKNMLLILFYLNKTDLRNNSDSD